MEPSELWGDFSIQDLFLRFAYNQVQGEIQEEIKQEAAREARSKEFQKNKA